MSVQQMNKRHSTPKKSRKQEKKQSAVGSSYPKRRKRMNKDSNHVLPRSTVARKQQSTQKKRKQTFPKKKRARGNKAFDARIKQILKELGISLTLLGTLLYILSFFTCSLVKTEGYSMIPTLNNSEWVLVNKLAKTKRHKLILYKEPQSKETSVRRVIGLPGERIRYNGDKLYINDQEIFERYIETEIKLAKASNSLYTTDWQPVEETIPKGKYIILGDNRPYATDSRQYGYIDEKEIVGVVEMRVFPIHQIKQF